jgi:predicted phosphodiesterase
MSSGEALVTADIHLAINPRDHYRLQYMRTMPDRLKRGQVDSFVILGDLCEEKDEHNSWLVNQVTDLIVECAIYSKVYILLGNHDYIDRAHPFFVYLRHLHNVVFITEPCIYKVKGIGIVTWLPHTRQPEKDWEAVVCTDAYRHCDVVFAHQTFEGAQVANGKRLSGVPTDLLPYDKTIIAGDIHVPQTVGRVEYVGSPYRIDFGDEWDGRLLRYCNGKRMNDLSVAATQKRLIKVRKPEEIGSAQFNRGDILKVMVDHNDNEPWSQTVSVVRGIVARMGAIAHTVVPTGGVALGKRVRIKQRKQAKDDLQVVEEFGKRVGVDDRTLKTGKFIMGRSKA